MKQTENLQLPILQNGDKYTKETQNEAFKKVDLHLGGLAKRVNNIVASGGESNIEIVDARVDTVNNIKYNTIGERMNNIASQLDNITLLMPPPTTKEKNTENLQKLLDVALDKTKAVTIRFNKGEYDLDECYVHSNTTLLLSNETILYSEGCLFFNAIRNIDKDFTEYNGNGNILIEGGNIHSHFFSMIHGYNITFKNINLKHCTADHYIEISSSRNVLIENCTFEGMRTPEPDRQYVEYIQIDGCSYEAFPRFPNGSPCFDETPNENITIRNCIFKKSNVNGYDTLCTAIGSHGDILYPNKNLVIDNCTIIGASYSGIRLYNNDGVVITNNTIKDCQKGITSSHSQTSELSKNNDYYINNNKIIGTKTLCLHLFMGSPTAYGDKVIINNNVLSQLDYTQDAINIVNSNGVYVTNNKCKTAKRLIYTNKCDNVTIENNIIEDIQSYAMSIYLCNMLSIQRNNIINSNIADSTRIINLVGVNSYSIIDNVARNIESNVIFQFVNIYDEDNFITKNGTVRNNRICDSSNNYRREVYSVSGVELPNGNSKSKTLCTIGDSITNGGSTNGYWQDSCVYDLPINKYYKNGYNGYTMAKSSTNAYNSIWDKLEEIPVADIYTVWLGTNDFSRDVPIGSLNDDIAKLDSFYGGLKQVYVELCKKNDKLPIVIFITPMKRITNKPWNNKNANGNTLTDYVEAIKEFANYYGCPVIDMFNVSTVGNNTATTLLYDGLHPNAIGNERFGTIIKNHLKLYI